MRGANKLSGCSCSRLTAFSRLLCVALQAFMKEIDELKKGQEGTDGKDKKAKKADGEGESDATPTPAAAAKPVTKASTFENSELLKQEVAELRAELANMDALLSATRKELSRKQLDAQALESQARSGMNEYTRCVLCVLFPLLTSPVRAQRGPATW